MPSEASAPSTTRSRRADGRRSRSTGFIILIFITCVLVLDALVGERGLVATLRARREHQGLAAEIDRARRENAQLREQARRLREDPATVEEIARRELGLIKPGEKLFIIRDLPPPTSPQNRQ